MEWTPHRVPGAEAGLCDHGHQYAGDDWVGGGQGDPGGEPGRLCRRLDCVPGQGDRGAGGGLRCHGLRDEAGGRGHSDPRRQDCGEEISPAGGARPHLHGSVGVGYPAASGRVPRTALYRQSGERGHLHQRPDPGWEIHGCGPVPPSGLRPLQEGHYRRDGEAGG